MNALTIIKSSTHTPSTKALAPGDAIHLAVADLEGVSVFPASQSIQNVA